MQSYYEAHREKITYIDFMETPSFCEPHFHSAVEILYASEGEVDTFINGAPRTIGKGEICISDSYDVHNFDSHGLKCRILIIPSDFLDDYFKVRGKKHVASNYVTDKALCVKIDAVMRQFCDKPSPLLSKAYVNLILGLIADKTGFSDAAAEDFHIMKKILDYLENNYSSDITLESLSAEFGYSKYYFSRIFNRFFRFSLKEYLNRLRARQFILRMRKNEGADIMSTAFDCGFNSLQTFYRCFTNYYGMAPKKYLAGHAGK